MSNLLAHARREFEIIGYDLDDQEEGPNKWIVENVLELIKVFGEQGHSGSSALYAIGYFEKLAEFEPLTPLTGEESEWGTEASPDQNNRCSHIFRDEDGQAYDARGRVFREPNGMCYTSKESHVNIKFPHTPACEYIDVR